MRLKSIAVVGLVLAAGTMMVTTPLKAQARSSDPNITMMDNCSDSDSAYTPGQTVNVNNRGGRAHTFTEVANYGGGFVSLLNGAMTTAPECADPTQLQFVAYGGSQKVTGLDPGLHKFQCRIHPWMRGAVRVN